MSNQLVQETAKYTEQVLDLANGMDDAAFNTPPAGGGWSAAQVLAHLFKSDAVMLKLLHGTTRPGDRPADQRVAEIRGIFLDFTARFKSPPEIVPTHDYYEKEGIINSLRETRKELGQAITSLDMDALVADRNLGELSRLEIFHFVIYHTQRHLHQLQEIRKAG